MLTTLALLSNLQASTPLLTDSSLPLPPYPAMLLDDGGPGVVVQLSAVGEVFTAALQAQALNYLIYIDMAPPPGAEMDDPPPPGEAPQEPRGAIGPPGRPPSAPPQRRTSRRLRRPRRPRLGRPLLLAAALAGCVVSADIDGRSAVLADRTVVFSEDWRVSEAVDDGPEGVVLVGWSEQQQTPVALSIYQPPANPLIAGLFGGGSALDRLAALAPRPAEGTTVRITRIPNCGIQREIRDGAQWVHQLGVVAESGLLVAETWGGDARAPRQLLCPEST